MPDTSAPFGFRPVKHFGNQGNCNVINTTYKIDPSNTTKIYQGEPVYLDSNGWVVNVTTATSTGDIDVTAGQYMGIFWGCEYTDTSLGYLLHSNTWQGSADTGEDVLAYVIDDPGQLFLVEADAALSQGDLGKHASMAVGSSRGDDVTGFSKLQLDASTATAATASGSDAHTWVIVGTYATPNNAIDDDYPWVRVKAKQSFHTAFNDGTA